MNLYKSAGVKIIRPSKNINDSQLHVRWARKLLENKLKGLKEPQNPVQAVQAGASPITDKKTND